MRPTKRQLEVLKFLVTREGSGERVARTHMVNGIPIQSRYLTVTLASCVGHKWVSVDRADDGYWYAITPLGSDVLKSP